MLWHAGMDCSGTPDLSGADRKHDPYTLCVLALQAGDEPAAALRRELAVFRARFRLDARREYRGHAMSDTMQADLLELLRGHEMAAAALLVSKAATREKWGGGSLPSSAGFQVLAARANLEPFMRRYCLARLWCDEDIHGRGPQRELTTELLRIHRDAWPGEKLKVRFMPSGRELLIQLADVLAYGLACYERGTIRSARLKRVVEAVRSDPRNLVTGPVAWDSGEK